MPKLQGFLYNIYYLDIWNIGSLMRFMLALSLHRS